MYFSRQEAKDFGATHTALTQSGKSRYFKRGKCGQWVVMTLGKRDIKIWEGVYLKTLVTLPEKME